jgi:ribosome-binding factor A
MSGGSRRRQQVADLVRDEVSAIIQREMKDPRLGFASITRVEMSPDLRYARIFVSVYADEEAQRGALLALNHAHGFIRHQLAPRLKLRQIPELTFRLDHSMAHAETVARLLRQIEEEPKPAVDDAPGLTADTDDEAST